MIHQLKRKFSERKKKKKFLHFYKEYIKSGDLCFDIGANVGERTDIFLDLGAQVVAVEPVDESMQILQQRFNKDKSVSLLPVALGNSKGEGNLHVSNYSELCTLSDDFIEHYKDQGDFNIHWDEIRPITIMTLDQLIGEYGLPNFCKIDVEGYENEVLKGLSQPLPMISFEYNARLKQMALDCLETLAKLGPCSYNFSPYETMQFSFNTWMNHQDFHTFINDLPKEVETGDIYVQQID